MSKPILIHWGLILFCCLYPCSEKAIIAYQEAEETLEIELEKSESRGQFKSEDWKPPKPQIDIPPIPVPPSPPKLSDMDGVDPDLFDDQYPLYTPKGDQQFVAHLDKECFHVVDGRYFGLLTTSIWESKDFYKNERENYDYNLLLKERADREFGKNNYSDDEVQNNSDDGGYQDGEDENE